MNNEMTDDFIRNWLSTGPVAHVCTDNEAFYAAESFHGQRIGIHRGQKAFSRDLGLFAGKIRKAFLNAHICTPLNDKKAMELRSEGFRVDRILYDAENFTAEPVADHEGNAWCDLFVSDYNLDWVHIKDCSAWNGAGGEHLADKLKQKNCRKIVATGAFAEACVLITIMDASKKHGFEVMVDPALAWSTYGDTITRPNMEKQINAWEGVSAMVSEPGQAMRLMLELAR